MRASIRPNIRCIFILPSETSNFASLTEVLICESVLVGKVPDSYLQADIFGNGYDLVPRE